MQVIYPLRYELIFPDPRNASDEGLLAYGGDLSPNRLLFAYREGIFPWYNANDPILWWSPNPRTVLFLDDFKISKSLHKRIRNGGFEVRYDSAFKEVMEACSTMPRNGQSGSWIVPEMVEAYATLFEMGYAHSIESYHNGLLVGGLYGVAIGKAFFGESMFAKEKDASKVALAHLVERLKSWGFEWIDAQIRTEHLMRLGAKEISREHYLEILHKKIQDDGYLGSWRL